MVTRFRPLHDTPECCFLVLSSSRPWTTQAATHYRHSDWVGCVMEADLPCSPVHQSQMVMRCLSPDPLLVYLMLNINRNK